MFLPPSPFSPQKANLSKKAYPTMKEAAMYTCKYQNVWYL